MGAVRWLRDRLVSERKPMAGPWASLMHSLRLGGLRI